MVTPGCPPCSGKLPVISGGLCSVCRSLDRLAAYCRGPQLPAASGDALLTAVRTWIRFVQDLSETQRGVVPCPRGTSPLPAPVLEPPPGDSGGEPPAEPTVVAGATPKAPGAPPATPPKEEKTEPEEEAPDTGPRKEAPSSSHRSQRSPREEKKSRTPKREKKKKSKKSRSRRGRRDSRARLASPVRPAGVKEERSPGADSRGRRKARPRSPSYSPPRPRSPYYSPRRSPLPRRVGPSARPEGQRWSGPIRALPREPTPGQGKHFGKNKGVGKRKRNKAFWRGAGQSRR